jgi:hypothetical protein
MKVQAKFNIVYAVTRDVEVDEQDFREWAHARYGETFDMELAVAAWIEAQDTDLLAEVFPDWKTSAPLPNDFELQYTDVLDVTTKEDER